MTWRIIWGEGILGLQKPPPADKLYAMKTTVLEPEIVTRKGKPVSVILPIKDYEELLERVEDAADVTWLKRARQKPLRYRPLENYLAERRRN
jgi:hypothetical protein